MPVQHARIELLAVLVSLVGVLQSLAGVLVSGLVILFLMCFRGIAMNVGGVIVQLGGSLMIFVMRFHCYSEWTFYKLPILPDLL